MKSPWFSSRWARSLIAPALALTAACAFATPTGETQSRVTVTWTNPADFADVRDNPGFHPVRPEEWLGPLAQYLQRRADKVLAPGQHLDVTFTDIKRAGSYEPWRGPRWDDIRIVKDIYPPRIDLRYTLTGSDGARLREGEAKLSDLAFLSRGIPNRDDPLRYEKRLLDNWLRREFPASGARRN